MSSKPGISAGCIVAIVLGAFFLLAAVVLAVVVGVGFVYTRQSSPASEPPLAQRPVATPSSDSATPAERPSPTPEQMRALDGGKTVEWKTAKLHWTVPANWNVQRDVPEMFEVKSPGSFDAGWLAVNISPPFPDSFPADVSIKAMYQQALDQKKTGKYTEVRWLELAGVRGVEFAEAPPANPDDVQRVEWQGYTTTGGQTRLLTIMAHSSGKGFPTYADTLYGTLYSTKVSN
jgi:hypothetical protein